MKTVPTQQCTALLCQHLVPAWVPSEFALRAFSADSMYSSGAGAFEGCQFILH